MSDEIELIELRAENARLRKRLSDFGYHAKRVEQAYRDALLLALWKSSGIRPSRSYAVSKGITQPRWENALALLRMARIVRGLGSWVTVDAAEVEAALERTRKRATTAKRTYKAHHIRDRKRL